MELRKWGFSAVLLLTTVVAAACGGGKSGSGGGAAASKGDVAKGKEAFAASCVSCHGADAKGVPGLGKDLTKKSEWLKKQNEETLTAFIRKGRTAAEPENTTKVDMPPKGGNPALTDADMQNLAAYILSIAK